MVLGEIAAHRCCRAPPLDIHIDVRQFAVLQPYLLGEVIPPVMKTYGNPCCMSRSLTRSGWRFPSNRDCSGYTAPIVAGSSAAAGEIFLATEVLPAPRSLIAFVFHGAVRLESQQSHPQTAPVNTASHGPTRKFRLHALL